MDVTGWWASGTTYITFENTNVPKDYVIGVAGAGFRQMMTNLNHERWSDPRASDCGLRH